MLYQAKPVTLTTTSEVKDYLALLKPRVMALVVFSGLAGIIAASGNLHPILAGIALLCIATGCGGAAAINMWYERDRDALMTRTRKRPLVQGRIDPNEAISFAILLNVASVTVMGLALNWLAAALLAIAILFYVFIYTIWLKPRTAQNIVIGGAAGAFPPLIGWASVNGDISLASLSLFLLIFLWTPPHFWSLSLYRCEDYRRANIPMLPVTAGKTITKINILLYTIALFPAALLPTYLGIAGELYATAAIILGTLFIILAIAVCQDKTHKHAKRMFAFSIIYLFALFATLMLDNLIYA